LYIFVVQIATGRKDFSARLLQSRALFIVPALKGETCCASYDLGVGDILIRRKDVLMRLPWVMFDEERSAFYIIHIAYTSGVMPYRNLACRS
jgi:hypothetical protein